jgi:CubicO group peptidase (beta-lactamase class C family)
MRPAPIALLALSLAALPATAQAPRGFAQRADQFLKAEMARQELVGLSVAVLKDGKVVLERGLGYANLEHKVPATPATVYQSGSVGKQFTAAAIMLLEADGLLRIEDPVTRYFPAAPAEWQQVTLEHLLTHTAGAGDYPDDFDFRHDYTEDELRTFVFSRPLRYPPGSQWEYSNMGYVLLGLVVRQVTGRFYGDVLAERVFQPLGMTTTRVIDEAAIIPNRAAGYEREDGVIRNQTWVAPRINTTADGALYLTVRDLARWDQALHAGTLLSPAQLARVRTPVRLSDGSTYAYGYGWRVGTAGGQRLMEHGGSWQGFKAHILRYPEAGLTVVALANAAWAQPYAITHGLAQLWDPGFVELAGE